MAATNRPRVALITGCSEGGLGAAFCCEYAKRGCKVYATARNIERMRILEPHGCILRALDVTDTESVHRVVSEIMKLEGRIDVLVNNAGVAMKGSILDTPMEASKALFEANYWGCLALTKEVAPAMIEQRSGIIVNIGSITGCLGCPFHSQYCASKIALKLLSDTLRKEMLPFNVKVMHCTLGFVHTELFNNAHGQIFCDPKGPYHLLADKIGEDFFKNEGRTAPPVSVVAARLVAASLSRSPPRVYRDGGLGWVIPLIAAIIPDWVLDLFAWLWMGLYKLAPQTAPGKAA